MSMWTKLTSNDWNKKTVLRDEPIWWNLNLQNWSTSTCIWPENVHEGRWFPSKKYQGTWFKGDNYFVCGGGILGDLINFILFLVGDCRWKYRLSVRPSRTGKCCVPAPVLWSIDGCTCAGNQWDICTQDVHSVWREVCVSDVSSKQLLWEGITFYY